MPADTILHNAKIATNSFPSFVNALAITDGQITATGSERDIFRLRGPATRVIDANGRTVVPGLNDSHIHPIRGGLNYNMELRWDGVPSVAEGPASDAVPASCADSPAAAKTAASSGSSSVPGRTPVRLAGYSYHPPAVLASPAHTLPPCTPPRCLTNTISLLCSGLESVVVYFSTATKRRSRAALWSIIAPPFTAGRFLKETQPGRNLNYWALWADYKF
jgi:hypothetical protein